MEKKGLKQIETVIDVYCDVCGNSCKNLVNGLEEIEFASVTAKWGYTTSHDGQSYHIHLCESCFFQSLANLREARRTCRMLDANFDPCKTDEIDPIAEQ